MHLFIYFECLAHTILNWEGFMTLSINEETRKAVLTILFFNGVEIQYQLHENGHLPTEK